MSLVIGIELFGFSFFRKYNLLLQIKDSLIHFCALFLQRVDLVLLSEMLSTSLALNSSESMTRLMP